MSLISSYTLQELKDITVSCSSITELAETLGYKTTKGNNLQTLRTFLDVSGIDYSHFSQVKATPTKYTFDTIFCKDCKASQKVLRCWYEKNIDKGTKCAICGIPNSWNGKPLVLTLDHINGDKHDNRLSNLRWICPNCDRQLPTFGFKNRNRDGV